MVDLIMIDEKQNNQNNNMLGRLIAQNIEQ